MNTDSSLVTKTLPTTNYTGGYNKTVKHIVIHHAAGILTSEGFSNAFKSRSSSSTYSIDKDGVIAQHVPESVRQWCTSSWEADYNSVTIEVSNDTGAPTWHVSDKNIEQCIKLVADICKRHGIAKCTYIDGDKDNSVLQMHRWWASTSCPGPYLGDKFGYICAQVNAILENKATTSSQGSAKKTVDQLADEVYTGKWGNDPKRSIALSEAGYDAGAVQARVNEKYYGVVTTTTTTTNTANPLVDELADRVYRGEFGNGPERVNRIKALGVDPDAVQARVNEKYYGIKSTQTQNAKSAEQVAKDIISLPNYGGWGTDPQRRQKLIAAGYNPDVVQAIINKMVG